MNEAEARDLSDDLLLDNFHWSKVSDKEYDLFRAELIRRLPANKKAKPEDVQLDVEARELESAWEMLVERGIEASYTFRRVIVDRDAYGRAERAVTSLLALLRRESGKGAQECKYSPSGQHVAPRGICQYCEEYVNSPAPVPATPEPITWKGVTFSKSVDAATLAEEIINHVAEAAVELIIPRNNLVADDDEEPLDIPAIKEDLIEVLMGRDSGCIAPEDLDEDTCEYLWVESRLQKLIEPPATTQGTPEGAK